MRKSERATLDIESEQQELQLDRARFWVHREMQLPTAADMLATPYLRASSCVDMMQRTKSRIRLGQKLRPFVFSLAELFAA